MTKEVLNLKQKADELFKGYYPENIPCKVPDFLQSMDLHPHLFPTSILFVINFSKRGYEYVSGNISSLFSITPEELLKNGLNAGITLFSEKSANIFVNNLLPDMMAGFENAVEKGMDVRNIRAQYNVIMNSPARGTVNTLHVLKPALIAEDGMPLLALKYIFDISGFARVYDLKLTFEYLDKDSTQTLFTNIYSLDTQKEISKREFEILTFIEMGMSSKEIADKLCLSIHTVNTHRKNIMKKFNVQNFQQSFYRGR